MNLAVFGLGYVGAVTAACFAARGHRVRGVDTDTAKVDLINEGSSPVIEPGLDELIAKTVSAGQLSAGTDASAALQEAEISLVCVGTPSDRNDGVDLNQLTRVTEEIGTALARSPSPTYHLVTYRSTMLPGTVEERLMPVLERASSRRAGREFGVAMNPEFLREGTSVRDFQNPPFVVIGESDQKSGAVLSELYSDWQALTLRVSLRSAELLKYSTNAFHALKIAFANEIGRLCSVAGVDALQLMEAFCRDHELNISTAYLRPGAAFGGSCLPKDLRALTRYGRRNDIALPLLESILVSNQVQKRRALRLVQEAQAKRVGVVGLSFKPDTDDLRESPAVELVEQLIGKGHPVRIYDPTVRVSRLRGANREFIDRHLPHFEKLLMEDLEDVIQWSDALVVTANVPDLAQAIAARRNALPVIDLVGSLKAAVPKPTYRGICW